MTMRVHRRAAESDGEAAHRNRKLRRAAGCRSWSPYSSRMRGQSRDRFDSSVCISCIRPMLHHASTPIEPHEQVNVLLNTGWYDE